MLLEVYQKRVEYTRLSKSGTPHVYFRTQKVARLQCDNCNSAFERRVSNMDHRRLGPDYEHVCPDCGPKRFAQRRGVERRKYWSTTVDLDVDIDQL